MTVTFGVHTGLQNTTVDELRTLWTASRTSGSTGSRSGTTSTRPTSTGTRATRRSPPTPRSACHTSRVRCGSLVYCAGYRHPAVLANAIATIDHLSGGRADLGLGAGWAFNEYAAYGIPFPPAGERLDILEEAVQCVRLLLREDVADFEGEHFELHEAHCEPKPVQAAAAHLDRRGRREAHAEDRGPVGRRLERAVRVARRVRPQARGPGPALRADRPGPGGDPVRGERRPRVHRGVAAAAVRRHRPSSCARACSWAREDEIVDAIGRYVDAGADQVNLALRAPWDLDGLDRFAPLLTKT